MGDNPENERMPEVKQALEALKDAEPQPRLQDGLQFRGTLDSDGCMPPSQPAVRHGGENRLFRKRRRLGGVRLPHHENHRTTFLVKGYYKI